MLPDQAPNPCLQDASFCLAWTGEGTEAEIVHGWPALLKAFAAGVYGGDTDTTRYPEWAEWVEELSDDLEWSHDEDGRPFSWGSDIGEISHVTIYRLSAPPAPAQPEPMFWVRLCSDNTYEGPIHNARIEEVRKQSGAWTPLYAAPTPQQELQAVEAWRDIETAPMDGAEILAWREDCGQFIASYTSPESFPLTQDEIDSMDDETLFTSDWFTQWPQALRLDGSEAPTRWRPLPAPPALAAQPQEQKA